MILHFPSVEIILNLLETTQQLRQGMPTEWRPGVIDLSDPTNEVLFFLGWPISASCTDHYALSGDGMVHHAHRSFVDCRRWNEPSSNVKIKTRLFDLYQTYLINAHPTLVVARRWHDDRGGHAFRAVGIDL